MPDGRGKIFFVPTYMYLHRIIFFFFEKIKNFNEEFFLISMHEKFERRFFSVYR